MPWQQQTLWYAGGSNNGKRTYCPGCSFDIDSVTLCYGQSSGTQRQGLGTAGSFGGNSGEKLKAGYIVRGNYNTFKRQNKLSQMAKNAKSIGITNATERIYEIIKDIMKNKAAG